MSDSLSLTVSLPALPPSLPLDSCFVFTLTHRKPPPFCQEGYLRMRGLMGTESLQQHRAATRLQGKAGWRPVHQEPAQRTPEALDIPKLPHERNREEL